MLDQIKQTDWHVRHWRAFFCLGWISIEEEYAVEEDSFTAIERGGPPPALKRCWIFLRKNDVQALELKLSADGTVPQSTMSKGSASTKAKRGPKKGEARYGDSDRKLFPELELIMRENNLRPNGAAPILVHKIVGSGTPESKARRLAKFYIAETKLTEIK